MSRNITAFPMLWPGPSTFTTFSMPLAEEGQLDLPVYYYVEALGRVSAMKQIVAAGDVQLPYPQGEAGNFLGAHFVE